MRIVHVCFPTCASEDTNSWLSGLTFGHVYEGCPKSSGPYAIQVLKIYYIYKITSEPFNIIPLARRCTFLSVWEASGCHSKAPFYSLFGSPGSVWPSAPECPQNESRASILLVSGLERSHRDSYPGCRQGRISQPHFARSSTITRVV